MKLLSLFIIVSIMILSSAGCSKDPSLSGKNSNDSTPGLLGKWKAIGYYSTYFMAPNPSKIWVSYPSNEQFTYEFRTDGKLNTFGKPAGCQYQHFNIKDSANLQLYLFSNNYPTEKYTILKLTTDSLYLSKAWYENQFIYVFTKIHRITENDLSL